MSDKKVYAMAGADCETAGGLPQGYPFLVLREYDSGFIFIDETGTELYGLWKGCYHLHGADWTRLELEESEADEKRTIAQGLQSDPIASHPNSEPDADRYSVGADTVDDCDDRLPLQYEPAEERTSDGAVSMADQYPAYYKDVSGVSEVDVYAVHQLFGLADPSGCIHHASKKLLLSGVRTGGKSKRDDIREARDTLTRWLDLNHE